MLRLLFPLLVLFPLLLGGCSQTTSVLRYSLTDSDAKVWPALPDEPRYQFVGQLTGEENIQRNDQGKAFGKKVLSWLVGIIAGEREAVVLQRPQGIFVDGNRIYVTDVSRGAVYVFDENGGQLHVWEMAGDNMRFETPVGIASLPAGDVYVADAELAAVVRLDNNGNPQALLGKGLLKRPTGLALDVERQRLYVADSKAHDIKVFDLDGQWLETIGHRGEGEGEFNGPTYLAFVNNQLYVTDTLSSRVQILDENGRFIRAIGKRGLYLGDLPRPKGVAADSHGNVYVVESYYDYLLVFNDKGEFLLPIGGTGSGVGEFFLPAGVWVDSNDRVYVADAFNGRIMIFQYLSGT